MTKKQFSSTNGLLAAVLVAAVLTGCATAIPGASIRPGATVAQVEQSVGKPDMTWRNNKGKIIQAAYSDQPAGWFTFMVYFNELGVVERVDQVMDDKHFAMIKNGMTSNQVHKILGPERSVEHFTNLNQIDWNYGYCTPNDGRQVMAIAFDDRTMTVNGSTATPDPMWWQGDNDEAFCVPYVGQTNADLR